MINDSFAPPQTEHTADLISRAYPALKRMAVARARSFGMSPSSLTQEAICRLLRQPQLPQTEDHLHAAAWKIMEWVLIDRARSETARKRRENNREPLSPPPSSAAETRLDELSSAISALAEVSPRKAEVLTLSALCGLPMERIAELLEISSKTVQRDLEFAKAWVASTMSRQSTATSEPKTP